VSNYRLLWSLRHCAPQAVSSQAIPWKRRTDGGQTANIQAPWQKDRGEKPSSKTKRWKPGATMVDEIGQFRIRSARFLL